MKPFSFVVAVSAVAAASADTLLESVSDAGGFGPGTFTDRSMADVVPVLVCAVSVAAALVASLVRRALSTRASLAAQAVPTVRGAPALVPAVVALQLALLFAMETGEQIAVAGHPLGGTIWLGAPAAIALAVHALAAVLCTLGLAGVLRALADGVVRVIRFVRRLAIPWPATSPALRGFFPFVHRADDDARAPRRGRAPPTPLPI